LLLLITSDENRSQERNRDACLDRLHELVLRCLVPPKQRRATKPSKASKQRRLTEKKQRGERKRNRRGEHD
jgi:ribosome-associated protein